MSVPDKKLVLLIACITLGQENEVNKGETSFSVGGFSGDYWWASLLVKRACKHVCKWTVSPSFSPCLSSSWKRGERSKKREILPSFLVAMKLEQGLLCLPPLGLSLLIQTNNLFSSLFIFQECLEARDFPNCF